MKKLNYIISYFLLFFVSTKCIAQKDTVLMRNQQGFLFMTGYNINYDSNYSHVRSWGFSDYFFPTSNFDINCFLDSNKNISFKGGVRVEIFKTRNQIRKKAIKFNSKYNNCYSYDSFYVVPVIINYKIYDDDWPLDCGNDFFDIEVVNGSKLSFYHNPKVMLPTKITPTSSQYRSKK